MSQEKQDIKLDNSEQPKETRGFWQKFAFAVAMVGGYLGSLFGAEWVQGKVAEIAKEDYSAYQPMKGEKLLQSMKRAFKQIVDPKLWKGHLAFFSTLVVGVAATDVIVPEVFSNGKKVYPSKDDSSCEQLSGECNTNWQERTVKSEQVAQGFGK